MKLKKISVKMEGLEPIITIYRSDGRNKSTHTIGLFYPLRRIMYKIKKYRKYKELKHLGIKPYECEGCGDGWAEFVIEDPNEEHGTYKKLFVCESCVYFYDIKWTHKRLYNTPTDWRDDFNQFAKENPLIREMEKRMRDKRR